MKESRYFSLYLPEYKDDIDISEISDNFNRLDSGLEAMLIKKDITTNTINDISVFPPFWSVKNPHDFDVVIYDRIFEKEITVEAGKTYKAQVDHGTKLNIHVQGLHELEFTYYISTEQAIEAAKGSDYKLTQIASEEFSASYKLQVKPKGSEEYIDVPASAVINIPKDKVVKSGDVKTCQTDGVPEGFKKGDKYIDLVIDNDEGSHIYIPVNALVDNKAEGISYSNTTSKMKATNVQSAIDEVVTKIGALDTNKLDKTAVLNVWSEDEKSTEKTLSEKFIYDNLTTKHDFGELTNHVNTSFESVEKDIENVENSVKKLDEQINHRHKVFGFHINSANSNPSNAVTYLEDAIGATPAHMDYVNDKFDYGSWKDAFFMPRPCMLKNDGTVAYYLDENDYTKKYDGTDSDISNTEFEGNAMMEWGKNGQKIWYKVVPDAEDSTSVSVYISNFKQDDDYHAYSFIDKNGEYIDHFYTPIYNGSLISDKLRSLSGQSLIKDKSASAEINYAKANGDGWFTEVFCDIELINYLLILIGKSLDTQSVFGNGNQNGYDTAKEHNGVIKSGNIVYGDTECQLNKKGLFWGSNNTVSGVKVFGMENWWANQWRRFAGLVNVQGTAKFKLGYVNEDGSVADYNLDGSGYVEAGTLPSNGYATKMDYSNGAMIQKTTDGSATTYYCDYYYNSTASTYYALRGGGCHGSSHCGAFYVNLYGDAGDAYWDIGAALSCKPPFPGVN